MRISFIIILITAVSVGGVFLWSKTQGALYEVSTVRIGPAVEAIYATAIVEPVQWAAIAPIKTGRVVEILAQEGDQVQKNQILARLDDEDLKAQLEEARASKNYYQKEVSRAEKLIRTGSVSRDALDSRKMQLQRYQAQVNMFEQQISQQALSAPQDGTVLWRDVELGEVKTTGGPLFWVGKPRPLRLEAEVDEEDIPKIKQGQKVLITADAFPGDVLEGKINHISPKGDPVNKSYRVYMSLPTNTPLMIGMTVETNTIIQEKEAALLIPAEALLEDAFVWLPARENNRVLARKTNVETGVIGKENIEITSGLSDGDQVILPPFDTLEDGKTIRLK